MYVLICGWQKVLKEKYRKSQWESDLAELYLYCMEENDPSMQWISVVAQDGNTRLGSQGRPVHTVVSGTIGFKGTAVIVFMSSEKSWNKRMSNDFLKYAISGEHFQSGFQLIIQISEERNLQSFNLMKTYTWEVSRFLFAHTFYKDLNELQHYVYKRASAFNGRRKFSWLNSFFQGNLICFLIFI